MPRLFLIFSQSDCLIQIAAINSYTLWQTVQIQISWLLQKPTDLDLHCLQRQGISGFSRTRVNLFSRTRFYLQIRAHVLLSLLFKIIVGTHLNCLDKLRQFKWEPTLYDFRKKKNIPHNHLKKQSSPEIFTFFFFFFNVCPGYYVVILLNVLSVILKNLSLHCSN